MSSSESDDERKSGPREPAPVKVRKIVRIRSEARTHSGALSFGAHGSHGHGSHGHGSHAHGSHGHGSHAHGGAAPDAGLLAGGGSFSARFDAGPQSEPPSDRVESSHGDGGHGDGGHGHGHGFGGHGHGHGSSDTAGRVLLAALSITACFMLVEAAVGLYSGSLALLADAGHMLADAGALALALAAQKFAARKRTVRATYGFRRAEVLAAFVNGMALAGVAVLVLTEAIGRWLEPVPIAGGAMLLTAASGLLVNLVVAAILMRGQRSSINVRAAFAHVLSDALGSVAAILAGLAVVVWDFPKADPLLSMAIAVLVAFSGFRIMRETAGILLESAPPHLDVAAIESTIRAAPGVADVHDLHVWRISERFDTLTAHVVLSRGEHGTTVCRTIAERLRAEYGLDHVTIQPEAPPPDELVPVRRSRDGAPLER